MPAEPALLPTVPWWLDLLTLLPVLAGVAVVVVILRQYGSGKSYLAKQSDFLDHQRAANEQTLAQNKAYEDLIARQYQETNARSDQALSQSEEALRLHQAMLDELQRLNGAVARMAAALEGGGRS